MIEDLIGSGGMGRVYRARDTLLHRHVALKILSLAEANAGDWDEAKARMLREARAAAALQHPNAVAIFDLGTIDDVPYIAMELVPGRSLGAYIGDATIPWNQKLRWMLDAASALAAAHAVDSVHRDVKPENVLVRSDGRVKVLDFGIARSPSAGRGGAAKGGERAAEITRTGRVFGTLEYMAPEQILGTPFDGRADQFAWGVTAFELLSGTHPWRRPGAGNGIALAILADPPPSLRSLVAGIPDPVVRAIERALSKQPDHRFPLMEDLIVELDGHASVPAVTAATNPGRVRLGGSSAPTPSAFHAEMAPTQEEKLPAVRRFPSFRRMGTVLIAIVGVASATVIHQSLRPPPAPLSAPAVPTALALTDLPRPTTSNASALGLYVSALQAWRDANADVARSQLEEALEEEPSMGPAQLRYALRAFFSSNGTGRSHTFEPSGGPREHFARAKQLRDTLSTYDQALMDAVAPVFEHTPPDWAEAGRRLREATARLPNDAELFVTLAWVRDQLGDTPGVSRAVSEALKLDPKYAHAYLLEAMNNVDDPAAMRRAADLCLDLSSQATECLHLRQLVEAHDGDCTGFEADANRTIVASRYEASGYVELAAVSAALGRPDDAVLAALDKASPRYDNDERAFNVGANDFAFATLQGDAAKSTAALDRMAAVAKGDAGPLYQAVSSFDRVAALTEAGRFDRAGEVAAAFLRRPDRAAQGLDDFSLAYDVTPSMLKALVRAGKMTASEFEARRAAWVEGWKGRVTQSTARYLWIYGYAMTVDTPDEAASALRALTPYAPLPELRPALLADSAIGRTYLLAGQAQTAVPILRSAAANCDAFENPVAWVQASLQLGQALEKTGDAAGACAAYAVVVKRWGASESAPVHAAREQQSSHSTSAVLARQRMLALSCTKAE